MEPTVSEMMIVSFNLMLAYNLHAIIKIERFQIVPVEGLILSFYSNSFCTLFIITIYGIIWPVAWQFVMHVHIITGIAAFVFVLIYAINRRLNRHMKDLTVAVNKLGPMQRAILRLDPFQYSEECMEWMNSANNLQHRVKVIWAGYYGRSMNILKKLKFRTEAGQELISVNALLRQGDNLLHPHPPKHLWGTMNYYIQKVDDFIEDMDAKSGLLGIWGKGGVGKSSLLKLVCDSRSEYDDGSFKVVFVRAGIGCTIGQVQEAIATSMGLPLKRNETSNAKIIHDHLNDKSFLLLLDDLWGYLDLEAVGIPYPLGMVIVSLHGGLERQTRRKVVLTTRKTNLCHKMGCYLDNTIPMDCFNEEAAWKKYEKLFGHGPVDAIQGDKLSPDKPSGLVVADELLSQKPSGHVIAIKGDKLWPEKPSGLVVADEILPEKPSGHTKRQLARPQPHSVFDVKLQLTDRLPGITDAYKKVCNFIESRGGYWMGVCGMRGVGKTTLFRLVCDSYRDNICFDHVMFVGAGTGCMFSNVQHAIAINLDLDLAIMSSLDDSSRANHIWNYLKDKTFLLLLDDIREPLNWWSIGLPTLSPRRKIILATRSRAACALMHCRPNTIEMKCLGEADAWSLFRDKVGLGIIDDHPQVHHLAQQMVSRCGGLPLALCALGRAMSNKRDPREWRCAHSQFMATRLEPCEIDEKVVTSTLNAI